ncbi:hypothetical protein [Niveispirillum fermenti]
MTTMNFLASRAARNSKLNSELDLASLAEMLPVLAAALVVLLGMNFLA